MNKNIENVLATLDSFRTNDEMTYSAYSTLHDEISLLDDLLKEQEPIKPYVDSFNDDWWWATGCCGTPINFKTDKFCPKCGRLIKWDE